MDLDITSVDSVMEVDMVESDLEDTMADIMEDMRDPSFLPMTKPTMLTVMMQSLVRRNPRLHTRARQRRSLDQRSTVLWYSDHPSFITHPVKCTIELT